MLALLLQLAKLVYILSNINKLRKFAFRNATKAHDKSRKKKRERQKNRKKTRGRRSRNLTYIQLQTVTSRGGKCREKARLHKFDNF